MSASVAPAASAMRVPGVVPSGTLIASNTGGVASRSGEVDALVRIAGLIIRGRDRDRAAAAERGARLR